MGPSQEWLRSRPQTGCLAVCMHLTPLRVGTVLADHVFARRHCTETDNGVDHTKLGQMLRTDGFPHSEVEWRRPGSSWGEVHRTRVG